MSEALTRILDYARAFSEKIDRCRTTPFNATDRVNATDREDAYNRLNRFRERYLHEKSYLDPAEAQALRKVFEEDTFIKEMLDIRQIGEHAHKRGESAIRLMTNAPIPICVKHLHWDFSMHPSSSCSTLQGSSTPSIIYRTAQKPRTESSAHLLALQTNSPEG
jgi:hypothetical protein